jgi:glucosylceramidase
MYKKYLSIPLLLLSLNTVTAREVSVWLTVVSDGDRKDREYGSWDDETHYDAHQDDGFSLLKRVAPIKLRNRPVGREWQVTLTPAKSRQEIKGLGAAMTDASAFVLYQLRLRNPKLYEFTMQRLFSPEHGAGFSYLRRPIGSSDYTATKSNYTYADRQSEDLSTFSIDHDRRYIIPMLRDVLRIHPKVEIMGSPWSPPAWMKTNGQLHGITSEAKAAGATNRLKPEYFDLYADYFVRFVQAYAKEDVPIHAVTLQNEPQFDTAAYPCMRMTLNDQIELAKRLSSKFQAQGITTQIFVHDHNWQLHPNDRKVVGGDEKLDPVELVTRILSDPEAGPCVAGSAWHCYAGNANDMRAAYTTIRQRFPDKDIYCTELSGWGKNRGPWFGDLQWGLDHNWLGGLAAGASVALEWNLALDHKFGPTLRDDSEAMGLVTVNTDTWQDVRFEREFYAMAHVSLAARPGSRPVETTITRGEEETPDSQFSALGFVQDDGRRALFLMNTWDTPGTVEVTCDGDIFDCVMPSKSMATLVWGKR